MPQTGKSDEAAVERSLLDLRSRRRNADAAVPSRAGRTNERPRSAWRTLLPRRMLAAVITLAALATAARIIMSTHVEPHRLSFEGRFVFKIEATRAEGSVSFSVTVTPWKNVPRSSVEANVMMFDGQAEIRQLPLENLEDKQQFYHYQFDVATNQLTYSQFVLRDFGKADHGTSDAADSFWFFLKDFVPARK
jgi:hypothetical protein